MPLYKQNLKYVSQVKKQTNLVVVVNGLGNKFYFLNEQNPPLLVLTEISTLSMAYTSGCSSILLLF
jgi:hypothetical protein